MIQDSRITREVKLASRPPISDSDVSADWRRFHGLSSESQWSFWISGLVLSYFLIADEVLKTDRAMA
jgi:hypothetical protein